MSHVFGGHSGGILGVVGALAGAALAIPTGGLSLAAVAPILTGAATGFALGSVAGTFIDGTGQKVSVTPNAAVSPTAAPTPLPTPTAAPAAPTATTPSVQAAADTTAQDNAAAAGRASTLLTSGLGAADTLTTTKKTLLGA